MSELDRIIEATERSDGSPDQVLDLVARLAREVKSIDPREIYADRIES